MSSLEIVGIILLVINVLVIIGLILVPTLNKRYKINNKVILQCDQYRSEKEQRIVVVAYNIHKHPELLNANISNLTLYALDYKVKGAEFEKHPNIKGAIIIKYPVSFDYRTSLMLALADKRKEVKLSPDNGLTFTKTITMPDWQVNRKKHEETNEKSEAELMRKSLFLDYKNSDKQFRFDYADLVDEKKGTHVHINEGKSTSTTLRYQHIVPKEYLAKIDFVPESIRLYYTFEGYLYEFDIVYLGHVGDVYEWDLINLKPNTVYAGLSLSSSHNPLIRPSKAFYGITLDESGRPNNLDGAQIAVPPKGAKKHKMWDEAIAVEAIGENLADLQYKIIAKKHHEFYDEDAFIYVHEADKNFDEFPWLKTGIVKADRAEG